MELVLNTERCNGCGVCARVCPQKILHVENKKMIIGDIARCMGCFGCEDECKRGAVRLIRAPSYVEKAEIEPAPKGIQSCDVVIVGAGPAGLGAAITCAKAGLDTVVLERLPNRKLSHHTDGGVLFTLPWMTSVHCDEQQVSFPELDITIQANVAQKCRSLGLVGPAGLSTDNRFPKGVEAWAGDKDKLVHALIDEAEKRGARFWFNAKVEDVLKTEGMVSGVKLASGEQISAKVVVTADGVLGKISKKAGLSINEDDLWYGTILANEYDNSMGLEPGLYYFNGEMNYEPEMPITFGAVGITEVIHVMTVFLSRKKYYPAQKPMDYYVQKFIETDPRAKEKLGDALKGITPKMLTGCRGVFRGKANTQMAGDGVISVGDAWVNSGEIGNVPALSNGVMAGRTIIDAAANNDFSKTSLSRINEFATPKLIRTLDKNKDMKLLATKTTDQQLEQLYGFMQHMNYPVMMFGSPRQQGWMFAGFMLKNLWRFAAYPKIAKLIM